MKISRRNFLKGAMVGLGAALVGGTVLSQGGRVLSNSTSDSDKEATEQHMSHKVPDDPNRHWGFIIDLSKCDGCESLDSPEDDSTGEKPRCSYECRKAHFFLKAEPPQYWIRVYKLQETAGAEPYYFPKPCQNCQNPPCERVCPTGATYKRDDGTVLINHKICIGCRICMAACPYETRFFWFKEPIKEEGVEDHIYSPEFPVPHTRGTVSKCELCLHRVYEGQLPHCVSACPQNALYYGDLNEDAVSNGVEIIPVRKTVEEKAGYRFKEAENTNPSVYYLPPLRGSPSTKLRTALNMDIRDSGNTKSPVEVSVLARSEKGFPITSSKVTVSKETIFGRMAVAEGLTDSRGRFNCHIDPAGQKSMAIVAELAESNHHQRSEVKKRC